MIVDDRFARPNLLRTTGIIHTMELNFVPNFAVCLILLLFIGFFIPLPFALFFLCFLGSLACFSFKV